MAKSKSIGGHQSTVGKTDTWFTPPHIIKALGDFDLDPCTHIDRPFDIAKINWTIEDDGLNKYWDPVLRIWMNPPYNRYLITPFLKKISEHKNGISLLFARTDRRDFHNYIFNYCDSILFLKGRLTFLDQNGIPAPANGGAPNMLVAYGERNVASLQDSGIEGKHVYVNSVPMIIVGTSPSWKSVIEIAIGRLNKTGEVKEVYEIVETIAPDKVNNNPNYKAKIRQVLQKYFVNVQRGVYKIAA